jgi:hypothetical protein
LTPSDCTWCNGTGKRPVLHCGTSEVHGMPCACLHTDLAVPFIYQDGDRCGCGIAAAAMATRTDYAAVRKLLVMSADLSGQTIGAAVDVDQMADMLDTLGFAWQTRYPECHRLAMARDPWPCAPWADTHVARVRDLSDCHDHYICWLRDGRVLDPWWGVLPGLHRYPRVYSINGLFRVRPVE